MDGKVKEVMVECARASDEERVTFGDVVMQLIASRGRALSHRPRARQQDLLPAERRIRSRGGRSADVAAGGGIFAIGRRGRGQVDPGRQDPVQEFCRRIAQAGCVGYHRLLGAAAGRLLRPHRRQPCRMVPRRKERTGRVSEQRGQPLGSAPRLLAALRIEPGVAFVRPQARRTRGDGGGMGGAARTIRVRRHGAERACRAHRHDPRRRSPSSPTGWKTRPRETHRQRRRSPLSSAWRSPPRAAGACQSLRRWRTRMTRSFSAHLSAAEREGIKSAMCEIVRRHGLKAVPVD